MDKTDEADAKRFRWLLSGNGYFMEENYICGHAPTTEAKRDLARSEIDEAMSQGAPATTKLDAKFYGEIHKVKDNSIVPDDEYVVFLAKDNAFVAILPEYLDMCEVLGCDPEQIDAVVRMIDRVRLWRARNPDRLKKPDAKGEKLLDVS